LNSRYLESLSPRVPRADIKFLHDSKIFKRERLNPKFFINFVQISQKCQIRTLSKLLQIICYIEFSLTLFSLTDCDRMQSVWHNLRWWCKTARITVQSSYVCVEAVRRRNIGQVTRVLMKDSQVLMSFFWDQHLFLLWHTCFSDESYFSSFNFL